MSSKPTTRLTDAAYGRRYVGSKRIRLGIRLMIIRPTLIRRSFIAPSQLVGMMNLRQQRRFTDESTLRLLLDLGACYRRDRDHRRPGRLSRRTDGPDRDDDGCRRSVWLSRVLRRVLGLSPLLPVFGSVGWGSLFSGWFFSSAGGR